MTFIHLVDENKKLSQKLSHCLKMCLLSYLWHSKCETINLCKVRCVSICNTLYSKYQPSQMSKETQKRRGVLKFNWSCAIKHTFCHCSLPPCAADKHDKSKQLFTVNGEYFTVWVSCLPPPQVSSALQYHFFY